MTDFKDDFDWTKDDAVCVPNQPTTAVYTNSCRQVVIRQEAEFNEEHDHFIYISRDYVLTVVRAMLVNAGYEDAHLYEQNGMVCHDIDWPEGPFSRREVAMMNARPDIDWGAVHEDCQEPEETVDETVTETVSKGLDQTAGHVPIKERRARIRDALRADPSRSNRSIASDCGVSDKTVAAVRADLGANKLGENNADSDAEIRNEPAELALVAAE